MIYGCACSALQESSETKSYDCQVSALDGAHSVSAECIKSQKICNVVSERGKFYYTFEELQALANS
ncbi:MAG: hypothetical protein Q7T16_06020 [Candidatus Burarchaeum sp.]|nr:hypothetical protein [Candidatus Burarchaeum sp.]MDO8340184.1 hypothetical protein [Candidatus Burarchaeum sp.]